MKQPHCAPVSASRQRYACRLALCLIIGVFAAPVTAQQTHHHGSLAESRLLTFMASTAKSFAVLMSDAMAVMDDAMKRAPRNGVAEHDFLTMMIPHHQGPSTWRRRCCSLPRTLDSPTSHKASSPS